MQSELSCYVWENSTRFHFISVVPPSGRERKSHSYLQVHVVFYIRYYLMGGGFPSLPHLLLEFLCDLPILSGGDWIHVTRVTVKLQRERGTKFPAPASLFTSIIANYRNNHYLWITYYLADKMHTEASFNLKKKIVAYFWFTEVKWYGSHDEGTCLSVKKRNLYLPWNLKGSKIT